MCMSSQLDELVSPVKSEIGFSELLRPGDLLYMKAPTLQGRGAKTGVAPFTRIYIRMHEMTMHSCALFLLLHHPWLMHGPSYVMRPTEAGVAPILLTSRQHDCFQPLRLFKEEGARQRLVEVRVCRLHIYKIRHKSEPDLLDHFCMHVAFRAHIHLHHNAC